MIYSQTLLCILIVYIAISEPITLTLSETPLWKYGCTYTCYHHPREIVVKWTPPKNNTDNRNRYVKIECSSLKKFAREYEVKCSISIASLLDGVAKFYIASSIPNVKNTAPYARLIVFSNYNGEELHERIFPIKYDAISNGTFEHPPDPVEGMQPINATYKSCV